MSMRERLVVIVVEDDCEMNDLQRELLEVHGLDAVAAHTGVEAINAATRCGADAVLLDVMLPEMDGFETCRRLRGVVGSRVPIIMITALDNEDCRRRGFEAGADAYFGKPFDPDEIISTLRMLIGTRPEQAGDGDCDPRSAGP